MEKREIRRYMLAGIIGLVFNSLYIIVDGIFVSNILGPEALAAVTVAVPIVEILIALSLMISIGCGIYISSSMGRKRPDEARLYFNHGLYLMIVISLILMIIFLVFNRPIVRALGATDLVFDKTREYFIYFSIFTPFFMLNYGLGTWVRNDGRPDLAMIGQIVGAVLNMILDYVFMGPLGLGIKGAAIATGLGPILGIIILLPHFLLKKGNLYVEKIKVEINKVKKILLGGFASFAIEFSLGLVTFLCNIFIAYRFQEKGLVAFGVIGYINLLVLSIYLGMGQGSQPLVSYLMGEKNDEAIVKVYSYSLRLVCLVGVIFYGGLYFTKAGITSIFIDPLDRELTLFTLKAIDLFFVGLLLSGVNIITASIFEAKQSVKFSVLVSFMRSFGFLLPVLLFLNRMDNAMWLWLAVSLSELGTVFISMYLWKKEKHKKKGNIEGKLSTNLDFSDNI